MILQPFDLNNSEHHQVSAEIWNAACGPDRAFSADFVFRNTSPTTGVEQAGQWVTWNDRLAGFVLASAVVDNSRTGMGWIDVVAVAPQAQRHGLGRALLDWAEAWLVEKGCTSVRLGGSLRPFMPGLPEGLNTGAFFTRRGYYPREGQPHEWDVARSLSDYVYLAKTHIRGAEMRPVQPGEEPALLAFLEQAFPGRWLFEAQEYQRHGGRMSDYMLLWTDKGPQGFCQVTFEDSLRPIERFYPQRLPRPWGQLGPLGVAAGARGKGYGGYLIHAALRRLQEQGVNGCVIDWTTLLELYARFGFQPYNQYTTLLKALDNEQHG